MIAADVPASKFGQNRSVNLPGVTVTVQEMIDALDKIKPGASKLIKQDKDDFQESLVMGWPQRFNVDRAIGMGFVPDGTFEDTVAQFQKEMELKIRKVLF